MESFADLFEESLVHQEMRQGEVITAEIIDIDSNFVTVNAGLKSESLIPVEEFKNDLGEIEAKIGDFVAVAIESIEDGFGATKLSRERAKKLAAWLDLEAAMNEGRIVTGMVQGKVKGGLTVLVGGLRAFLPGSLVDMRPVKDTTPYEYKEMEFKVIKLDRKRNNVVVSRRAVLEETMGADREAMMENLKEGSIVKGVVKNITDYGAFVDLGGIDGLLHITDMAWRRVKHPSEVVHVGQELEAKILRYDTEKNRISLGIKQLEGDPLTSYATGHEKGSIVKGTIKTVEAKGATVQLDSDMEGYLRASEVSRDRVEDMRTHYKDGDEIEAMIINVDRKNRVINLSIKAKDMTDQDSAMKKLAADSSAAATGSTNLGALLKAKLENKNAE